MQGAPPMGPLSRGYGICAIDNEIKSLFIVLQTSFQTLCGFWNSDVFHCIVPPLNFCVSDRLSNLQALSVECIHVVYPFNFFIPVTFVYTELHARNCCKIIITWKPFHKCFTSLQRAWNPRTLIVIFSMFFLLNVSKLVTYYYYHTILYLVSVQNLLSSVIISWLQIYKQLCII